MQVFVYGTLRKGERNAHFLNEAPCLYENVWVEGTLHDTDRGYPVLFSGDATNKNQKVYGEIYDINRDMLENIDVLEGYVPGRSENLYERITMRAYTDNENVLDDVMTYEAGGGLKDSDEKIAQGDWKVHTYLQRSELYYFAYGSCMDDERFKQADVHTFFTDVVGRGLLNSYDMQFSRSTSDGGKADITEDADAITEGILYRVPSEAFRYLYKREGVHTGGYRPAIVTVVSGPKQYEALTFIGLDKRPETPPTTLYATEIIRGATGILSETYIKQLKEKIAKLNPINK